MINPGIAATASLLVLTLTGSRSAAMEPLRPQRVTAPPVIDGKLDDEIWESAPRVEGFKMFSPDFGKEPSQRTTSMMAYDGDHLYFAFRCQDTRPNLIKAAMTQRDNFRADDWVCINLDTFNDQQSLYAFYVNPLGIQMDSRYAANQEDFSVDLVWESAGELTVDGYTVEVSLPLKSLRYASSNPVTMSVFFERYVSRTTEHASYPPMDPAKGYAFLTQMSPITYENLEHFALLEILPALTYGQKYSAASGPLSPSGQIRDLSLTAKYGITSDLTLDGTYNPDFSQIEADAGQVDVNLRYALYYPEKRPFFLEGSEIYTLAATQASELDPIRSLVHTRTIINPLMGAKLSGKLGPKSTLALMYALDELAPEEGVGTYAHIPIVRFKWALADDGHLGAIYTGRELERQSNRVLGVDGMVRLGPASMLEYHCTGSQTRLPGQGTAQTGHAVGAKYSYSDRDIDYAFTGKDIAEHFYAATGYVTRTGIRSVTGLLRPKLYPESTLLQRTDVELFSAQTFDRPSGLWETFNHLSVQQFLLGALTVKAKYSYSTEIFTGQRFKTGGFHILAGGQWTKQFYLSVLYRRVNAIYYDQEPFQGLSNRFTAELNYQPIENIESDLSVLYSDFTRESDSRKIYEYPIFRERLTYQVNRYLFFRAIVEYNRYRHQILTDFLASFTYVPGTVVYLGYGSLYQKEAWEETPWVYDGFTEVQRSFFFKMSYLWRV